MSAALAGSTHVVWTRIAIRMRIIAIIEPRMAAAARSGTGAIAVGLLVARGSGDTGRVPFRGEGDGSAGDAEPGPGHQGVLVADRVGALERRERDPVAKRDAGEGLASPDLVGASTAVVRPAVARRSDRDRGGNGDGRDD